MKATLRAAVAGALVLALPSIAHAETTVLPADPQAGETVAIVVTHPIPGSGTCQPTRLNAAMQGTTVAVSLKPDYERPAWCRAGVALSLPMADRYSMQVASMPNGNFGFGLTTGNGASVTVAPSTQSQPQFRALDGNWFDPAQPGWGLNIVQGESGALFAVVLTYQSADPRYLNLDVLWYPSDWTVMSQGRWITPTTFRGALHAASAPGPEEAFAPAEPVVFPVGFLRMSFTNADEVDVQLRYANTWGHWIERGARLRRFRF